MRVTSVALALVALAAPAAAQRDTTARPDSAPPPQALVREVFAYEGGGRDPFMSLLRSGDSFGEMSLFDQAPRSAHCLAIEPTTLLVLSREDLLRHLSAHPRTAINLLGEMARRLRRSNRTD